jgi:5-methyltetrahydrofolate--homocysteine methyltransferase
MGTAPERILQEGLIAAMDESGALVRDAAISLCQKMLIAARHAESLSLLQPRLAAAGVQAVGKVIGTVKGDLHDTARTW